MVTLDRCATSLDAQARAAVFAVGQQGRRAIRRGSDREAGHGHAARLEQRPLEPQRVQRSHASRVNELASKRAERRERSLEDADFGATRRHGRREGRAREATPDDNHFE